MEVGRYDKFREQNKDRITLPAPATDPDYHIV